jgi:hypothetical protein
MLPSSMSKLRNNYRKIPNGLNMNILVVLVGLLQILKMSNWGRPVSEIGFDDIVYLLDGAKYQSEIEALGLFNSINLLWDQPKHSPLMAIISLVGVSLFAYNEIGIFAIFSIFGLVNVLILFKLIFQQDKMSKFVVVIFWLSATGNFVSNNFRPDANWIIMVMISIISLRKYKITNNIKYIFLSSIYFTLSCYIKPSYVVLQVLVFFIINIDIIFRFSDGPLKNKLLQKSLIIWNLIFSIFGFIYLAKYFMQGIQYNIDIRKAEIWAPGIGVESLKTYIFNIKTFYYNDLGNFGLISLLLIILISIHSKAKYLNSQNSLVKLNLKKIHFSASHQFHNLDSLLIFVVFNSIILILGTHQSSFFAFSSWFPIFILIVYMFTKHENRLIKFEMNYLNIFILLVVTFLNIISPYRNYAKYNNDLFQNAPNSAVAKNISSICLEKKYFKVDCDQLKIGFIGASDINDATVNWELMKLGFKPLVKPESYLSDFYLLRENSKNWDILIVLSSDVTANDLLPYNRDRSLMQEYLERSPKWNKVDQTIFASIFINRQK